MENKEEEFPLSAPIGCVQYTGFQRYSMSGVSYIATNPDSRIVLYVAIFESKKQCSVV